MVVVVVATRAVAVVLDGLIHPKFFQQVEANLLEDLLEHLHGLHYIMVTLVH